MTKRQRLVIKPSVLDRVTWSRADSKIAPLCSLCFKGIQEDDDWAPLMLWNAAGACAHFCKDCEKKVFV